MNENEISSIVIGAAIKVHKTLGPGLLEKAYQECLCHELIKAGLKVEKEVPMPLIYQEIKLDLGYRLDLLVENKLVIELKAVEEVNDTHKAQILTYLKLGGYKLGLLLNFNVVMLKEGIFRVVNGLEE
ncbi:MAG: GxxExxY protein [Bacteroidia bacterium]|nr:GxxExxY protein [Bacteroidia bacterium]